MTDQLLIIFGGTKQVDYQGIFTVQELSNVDVIQFDFVTETPNIWHNGDKWLNLQYNYTSLKWDLTIETEGDAGKIKQALQDAGSSLEWVNWGGITSASGNADGMSEAVYEKFVATAMEIITSYLNKINQYNKITMLAHSRGTCIVIGCLPKMYDLVSDKLQRIVLLDPVAINEFANPSGSVMTHNKHDFIEFANRNTGVEQHIVVRGDVDYPFATYSPELLGMTATGVLGMDYTQHYHDAKPVHMDNVYVHIAKMGHHGMLDSAFRTGFAAYMQIISPNAWDTMYYGGDAIDTNTIINSSSALAGYVNNSVDAQDVKPSANDSIYPYYHVIMNHDTETSFQVGRYVTFQQCLAGRKNPR